MDNQSVIDFDSDESDLNLQDLTLELKMETQRTISQRIQILYSGS